MKKSFIIPIILFLFLSFLTGCASSPAIEPNKSSEELALEQEKAKTKEEIINMQQEVIKLRQRILDDTQIKLDNAQATLNDLADARQKLADAKIKLDQLQGRQDLVVQELQNLFQFYVDTRGKMLEQLDTGKGRAKDLYELEIGMMETNIRLSEAILKIKEQ
jgi:hypothetical protein